MASINDLELEVRRLRRRLNAADNAPAAREKAEVDELLGDGTHNAERRGTFGTACAAAHKSRMQEDLDKARRELLDNPAIVDTPGGQGTFFGAHPDAPLIELRELVGTVFARRHPRPDDDSPAAEPGEFIRFRR